MNSLFSQDSVGQTYHLGGPQVHTVKEMVEFVYSTIREPYHGIYTPAGARAVAARAGAGAAAQWGPCSCPWAPGLR